MLVDTAAYDALAAGYDACYRTARDRAENALIAAQLAKLPAPILDIGCGTGLVADLRPDLDSATYLGIDPSRAMLHRLIDKHPDLPTMVGALPALPLLALGRHHRRYPAITSLFVLQHVPPDDLLPSAAAMAAAQEPGDWLFAIISNRPGHALDATGKVPPCWAHPGPILHRAFSPHYAIGVQPFAAAPRWVPSLPALLKAYDRRHQWSAADRFTLLLGRRK